MTKPRTASQRVGLCMRFWRQRILPETVPPERREMVPLAAVVMGATAVDEEAGQPPRVTKVEEL